MLKTISKIAILFIETKHDMDFIEHIFSVVEEMYSVHYFDSFSELIKALPTFSNSIIIFPLATYGSNSEHYFSKIRKDYPSTMVFGINSAENLGILLQLIINGDKKLDGSENLKGQSLVQLLSQDVKQKTKNLHYQMIVDSAPLGIMVIEDGKITFANQALARCFAFTSSFNMIGRSYSEFIPRLVQTSKEKQNQSKNFQNETTVMFESIGIKKNGAPFPIQIATNLLNLNNKDAYLVFLRNITTEKRSEKNLKEQKDRIQILLNNSPDAILVANPRNYKFIEINQNAIALFQFTTDEFKELTPIELSSKEQLAGEKTENLVEKYFPAVLDGDTIEIEWVCQKKERKEFPAILRMSKIDFGENQFVQITITDITVQKELEHAKEQLQVALKMDAIGRLAGGIAHDFNNMLGAILLYTDDLLESVENNTTMYDDLAEIKELTTKASNLTKKLLAFSRRRIRKAEYVDMREIIMSISKILKKSIREDMTLNFDLKEIKGGVIIDTDELEQALVNLVINAKDAMPDGGSITVSLEEIPYKKVIPLFQSVLHEPTMYSNFVKLEIKDTGVGIPEKNHHKVFEPFFTTKAEGLGTGLGLTSVYSFVNQSKGYINFKSTINKGTCFKIYFPIAEVEQSEEDTLQVQELQQANFKGFVALVADDNHAIRSGIARVFKDMNFNVFQASTGIEAVKIIEKHKIDILVSDVIMPKMDGIQLARLVTEKHPNTKILLISAYSGDTTVSTKIDNETYEFLEKPFSRIKFLKRINQILLS